MTAPRDRRQERIAAYKTTLRRFIDQRPSGIRRRIAEVTGTHKSFISQITNPSDATPLPARHIDTIFAVCHLSPEEQRTFLERPSRPAGEHGAPERAAAPYPHPAHPGPGHRGREEAEGAGIPHPGHGATALRAGGVKPESKQTR